MIFAPIDSVWIAAGLGFPRDFGKNQALAFYDDAMMPVAGFVFHGWQPEHGLIEMSAYATSPKWATRGNLRKLFDYPFGQCGCQIVIAHSYADNAEAARMWKLVGASAFHIPRLMGREDDGVLFTLTDDQWINSRMNHVQARSPYAA